MRYGNTLGPFPDRVDATADLDAPFSFVEVAVGGGLPLPEFDPTAFAAACDDRGLDRTLHLPTRHPLSVGVPEIADGTQTYFARALDAAAAAGAEKAVTHANYAGDPTADDPATLRSAVERVVDAGADRGVEVVVENLGHLDDAFALRTVGDALADVGATMCFDAGHAYMEGGNGAIESFLASYGDLVSHLHVHDARSRGDTHVPIGAGEIDYDSVAAGLLEAGFDGTVAVEVFAADLALCAHSGRRVRAAFDAAD